MASANFFYKTRTESLPLVNQTDWIKSIKVKQFLGNGSFGSVFKIHTPQGISAVKVVFHTDNELNLQAKREYDILKELRHENVVTIFNLVDAPLTSTEIHELFEKPDLEVDSETRLNIDLWILNAKREGKIAATFLEMELCGPSLRSWLVDETQNNCADLKIKIVQGLINGLKFLHHQKIIHRDLKPSNVLFSFSTGSEYSLPVKIGDFGNSRRHDQFDDSDRSTMTKGTFAYAAPEVMSRVYGPQADLFSLGLIIWEVLERIPIRKKAMYFDRLVNDKEFELVHDHPIIDNAKELIISLTQRRTENRTGKIDDVRLIFNKNYQIHDESVIAVHNNQSRKSQSDPTINKFSWEGSTNHFEGMSTSFMFGNRRESITQRKVFQDLTLEANKVSASSSIPTTSKNVHNHSNLLSNFIPQNAQSVQTEPALNIAKFNEVDTDSQPKVKFDCAGPANMAQTSPQNTTQEVGEPSPKSHFKKLFTDFLNSLDKLDNANNYQNFVKAAISQLESKLGDRRRGENHSDIPNPVKKTSHL